MAEPIKQSKRKRVLEPQREDATATVNYYVNPTTGNDSWDGTSPTFVSGTTGPKEHISAMIDALSDPIVDDVNINLAGTVGSPAIYLESAGKISLMGLRFLGAGASLTILPGIWNQPNYVGGGDPYGGSGSWDPTDGNKPCVIPCVEMDGVNRPINITGVTIGGIYTSLPGMKIGFGNMLILNYCKVIDPTPDPFVVNQAAVKILNPGLFKNDEYFGVSLESGSMLLGAQAISFAMPIKNQWIATVPRRNQFVIDESNTSSIIR